MKPKSSIIQADRTRPQTITCATTDLLIKNFPKSVVFFYSETLSADLLTVALRKVLVNFPIFAGRLRMIDDALLLECHNEGVQFSICDDDCSLAQMLERLPKVDSRRLVDTLDAKQAIDNQQPVFTVRLTRFSCGGTALGLCWHHSIGDMQTFMAFMKAWSAAANGLPYDLPLVVKDRETYLLKRLPENEDIPSNVRYLKTRELLRLLLYMQTSARRKATIKIFFSDSEIERMKRVFSEKAGLSLSRNDVLCAHLFDLITDLDDYRKERHLAIAINYRNKTGLPQNLLGNLVDTINILLPRSASPFDVAQAIRKGVDSFETHYLSAVSTYHYIQNNGGKKQIERFMSKSLDPVKRSIAMTNWAKFGIYNIRFLEAKPLYFTSVGDLPIPWICSIVEGFENKGLIYTASLPTRLIQKLSRPDSLKRLHQYRDPSEERSAQIKNLSWLR